MKVTDITYGIDYATDRTCAVGRIEAKSRSGVRDIVVLAFRFTDEAPGDWRPSWIGHAGDDSVYLPKGFSLPPEWVEALVEAEAAG